jgi:acetylxylan esterase
LADVEGRVFSFLAEEVQLIDKDAFFYTQSYFKNSKIPWAQGSDKGGYITIWPSSPNSGTCWDVSSKASLSHNGGGDSNAIANMVTYAIPKYSVNASRVFVTGGSSGAMMSNVLAATYPELFVAASIYSGVAAGCFVGAWVDQWNNACANGQPTGTPEKWGDTARAMYPGYNGTRPKMQIPRSTRITIKRSWSSGRMCLV